MPCLECIQYQFYRRTCWSSEALQYALYARAVQACHAGTAPLRVEYYWTLLVVSLLIDLGTAVYIDLILASPSAKRTSAALERWYVYVFAEPESHVVPNQMVLWMEPDRWMAHFLLLFLRLHSQYRLYVDLWSGLRLGLGLFFEVWFLSLDFVTFPFYPLLVAIDIPAFPSIRFSIGELVPRYPVLGGLNRIVSNSDIDIVVKFMTLVLVQYRAFGLCTIQFCPHQWPRTCLASLRYPHQHEPFSIQLPPDDDVMSPVLHHLVDMPRALHHYLICSNTLIRVVEQQEMSL